MDFEFGPNIVICLNYLCLDFKYCLCVTGIHNAKRVCGLPHPHFAAPCFDISARDDLIFIGFLIHMMEMPRIIPKYVFALLSTTNFIQ
jgi:hypothetical protein